MEKNLTSSTHRSLDLSLIPPQDWEKLTTEWNQTQTPYPQDHCIHHLIEQQARKTPHKVAITFNGQSLTYHELNQRANQLAHTLQQRGVRTESLVGICIKRSLEMFIGLLGILKAGAAYVPLDPSYPQEHLNFMVEDAQLSIIVTQQTLRTKFTHPTVQPLCLDQDWSQIATAPRETPPSTVTPRNLAYIIYTSGSTGQPKGVQIEHRGVVNLLYSMQQQPGLTSEDVFLGLTTISFDMSVPELYLPLICGAQIALVGRDVAINPYLLQQVLRESGVTVMQATPSTWHLLIHSGWSGQPNLKMLCGGESMTRSLADQLLTKGQSLWQMYGPTETTVWSTTQQILPHHTTLPIGHPLANTQLYIFSEPANRQSDPLQPVPIGISGELHIGGDGVARGYLNRPELNAERFIQDPLNPHRKLYKTGDLARFLPDGSLDFIGRIDHQVKIRGHRIELGSIESILSQHPAVENVALVPKDESSGTKRLVAYVVPHSSATPPDTQQVQQWENVWSNAYSTQTENPLFDSSGWNDSYTNQPMPRAEVEEWVNYTVEEILAFKPQQVLEIGCGKGLLLFRIAPHSQHYTGLDISEQAINHIKTQCQLNPQQWSGVEVSKKMAHELDDFPPASFDTLILNSVIQYFPNVEYLIQVLKKAIPLIKPGGKIFIGDVRHLSLLETFHTSVQLAQTPNTVTLDILQQRIKENIAQEPELLVHPHFFHALPDHFSEITTVETSLKRGRSANELIRFRYDVTLSIQTLPPPPATEYEQLEWQVNPLSPSQIFQYITKQRPPIIKITQIPNPRLLRDLQALSLLQNAESSLTVGDLKNSLIPDPSMTTIHPEHWHSFADLLNYKLYLLWSNTKLGHYDVILCQSDKHFFPKLDLPFEPLAHYTNKPIALDKTPEALIPKLRAFLQAKLPDYMMPSIFVFMDDLPLTPNGKIDRRSLPEPKNSRPDLGKPLTPPQTQLQKELCQIWSELLMVEQIGINDTFCELGGHSLLIIQLLSEIENNFCVRIALTSFLENPTILGLESLIIIRKKNDSLLTNNVKSEASTFANDLRLDFEIIPQSVSVSTAAVKHIFLTGATGFIGAFILAELLKQTEADIYCLVRALNFTEGLHKLENNLQRCQLWQPEFSRRIVPILGDLSQPYLGLSSQQFSSLAAQVDVIYHGGAWVNLVYSYEMLRATNVLGTQEVLRLACQGKTTPVHFISTLDVFQSPVYSAMDIIPENDPLLHSDGLQNGYAQTKWVAEKLVMEAQKRGLPASIYRLNMISGNSQTGVSNVDDLLCRLLKGMIQMASAPDVQYLFNITPVDYVSQAIVTLAQKPSSLNQAFHLINPNPIPFHELVSAINDFGYSVTPISYEEWHNVLLKLPGENAIKPLVYLLTQGKENQRFYLDIALFGTQNFATTHSQVGLEDASVQCSSVNVSLIKRYLTYLTSSHFLPIPKLDRQSGQVSAADHEDSLNLIIPA
ncbi:amino acid adenylation domain-containing protein [Spirulina subsalsa]|uniref:amino acid adenylation domain-containing protein n=1 Tax=Spirulina subsalsa TaxID=54311 RepID=UPI0002F7818A|nr:amino acid adenylation domain-containing protein [Spirulina subsalsa]